MKRILIVLTILVAASAPAYASDDEFIPLDAVGQIGLGVILVRDDTIDPMTFDGTFRIGKTWRATDRIRPGGFLELRTVGFDTFEVAAGPQTQIRLGELAAFQVRGGAGVDIDDAPYAVAGAQIGNFLIGLDVAARRTFDDGETTVTASLELSAVIPLVPVFVAMWRTP